jgi:hypothetical protein
MFELVVSTMTVQYETRSVEQTGYHSHWSNNLKPWFKLDFDDEQSCNEAAKSMNKEFIEAARNNGFKNKFEFAFCRLSKWGGKK